MGLNDDDGVYFFVGLFFIVLDVELVKLVFNFGLDF